MIGRLLRRSLGARLAAATVALAATLVVAVSTIAYQSAVAALDARLLDRLASQAEASDRVARAWVHQQRVAIEHVAALASQRLVRGATLREALPDLPPELLQTATTLLLAVPGGLVVASSDSNVIGQYDADQFFYQEGRRQTVLQPIYPSARDGRPQVTIATPVQVNGQTRAVLVGHLDLAGLEHNLTVPRGELKVDAYLVNRLAEFVSATRFGLPGHERGVHSEGIDAALRGTAGAGVYDDYRGKRVVGAWRWIEPLEMALVLEVDHDAAIAPARGLLLINILVGAIALTVLLFGSLAVTQRFTAPVLRVADAATAVAEGDLAARVPVAGTDELLRLSRAFNVMTERLATANAELEAQVRATRFALSDAHANRALLQDVVDSGTTLVLVVNARGDVLLANTRLQAMIGLAPGTATSTLSEISVSPAAPLLQVVEESERGAVLVERELTLGGGADAHAWQVVAFPIRRGGGAVGATGLIATDLTERSRAEESRRAQDAQHQQAQKLESLGIMAGGIAHDFNNLLGAILGNVELAQLADTDPALRKESLDQIAAASRRAAELTRQMLAYAGRASLRRETVDVRRVVDDLLPLVRAAQSKKVEFVIECPGQTLLVDLDPAQLSQILLNLLTNAAEAIGDRPGVVTLRGERVPRHAPSEARPNHIRLSVSDSGIGIAADVQQRIFDPFFSTKDAGRGLGLSAVRGIVLSLGGELSVHSEPGRGARFDVWLPAAAATEETPSAIAARLQSRVSGLALVVDDEASLRRVARVVLEKMGMDVVEAEDGIAALERYRGHRDAVRVVVLDLTMPGLGGGEVLREIRRHAPTLPVIIASGYDHADAATHFQQDPYLRFLQKPFNLNALREAVASSVS